VGGRYVLFAGVGLFAAGLGLVANATVAGAGAWSFLRGLLVGGFGLGLVYAPQSVVAMRNIDTRLAGAASGVLNTTRQLGAALGTAVVGALLQVTLAAALHDEAVRFSSRLPEQLRARFIASFAGVGSGGLDVGTGHAGAPAAGGLPAAAAGLAHQVFTYAFVDAMRTTLLVATAVVAVAAVTCLAITQGRRVPAAAPAREAPVQQGERRAEVLS
jgi:hypothetical protein